MDCGLSRSFENTSIDITAYICIRSYSHTHTCYILYISTRVCVLVIFFNYFMCNVCVYTGTRANIFVYEGAPNVLRPCINRLLDWNYKVALIFNFFSPSILHILYFFPLSISQETRPERSSSTTFRVTRVYWPSDLRVYIR